MSGLISGEVDRKSLRQFREQLEALALPPQRLNRLLWRIAKHGLIPAAKRHVREQAAPSGKAWSPRKKKVRAKFRRMMGRLVSLLTIHQQSGGAVRLYFKGGQPPEGETDTPAGVIGAAHDKGMSITRTAKQARKSNSSQYNEPATLRQAKRMKALGYTVTRGKKTVKPSLKFIVENYTRLQASVALRKLIGKELEKSWVIRVPPRVFLGYSDDEFNAIVARQLQGIKYGADVKAQDIKGKV